MAVSFSSGGLLPNFHHVRGHYPREERRPQDSWIPDCHTSGSCCLRPGDDYVRLRLRPRSFSSANQPGTTSIPVSPGWLIVVPGSIA